MSNSASCPFGARSLPGDGTPFTPSPRIREWREQAPFVSLDFQDGHESLAAVSYESAVAILQDKHFSMRPTRMPLGPLDTDTEDAGSVPLESEGDLDDSAQRSEELILLNLDGEEHAKLRRAATARFSLRQARSREPWVRDMVRRQAERLREHGPVVDLWREYARPIAAQTHCHSIGVPNHYYETFAQLFAGPSTSQQNYKSIRTVIAERRDDPGEDLITGLLRNPALNTVEIEALLWLLLGAGRDSVAYLIATASVALPTAPAQLAILCESPETIDSAVEESMRVAAIFITVFARTATEDMTIKSTRIAAGTAVAVSPVAAIRDPDRWRPNADRFEVCRDAFGHLSFGYGVHGCIGQGVARVEIKVAIETPLYYFPDISLVSAEQLEPHPFAHLVATYETGEVFLRLGSA